MCNLVDKDELLKIADKLELYGIKNLGNDMFRMETDRGVAIFNREGLKEFDKAFKEAVKRYNNGR